MRHRIKTTLFLVGLAIFSAALATVASADKLPKCSKPLCRDVGCSADVLCASGATVKTCAEICGH